MPFKRDLKSYRAQFERDGYTLLKDVLSESFAAYLQDFLGLSRNGQVAETGQWRIGGKKHQYLFSFPSEDFALRFRAGIADSPAWMKAPSLSRNGT